MSRAWRESMGEGIYRAHTSTCPSSTDKKPNRKCQCPYRWNKPWVLGVEQGPQTFHGSITEARALKRKQKADSDSARKAKVNTRGTAPSMTLHEWSKFCMRSAVNRCKPSTLESYDVAYGQRVFPHLGNMRLDAITPRVVDQWMQARIKSEGNIQSVFKAYQVLRLFLNEAVRQELIDSNPVTKVPYPKKQMKKMVRSRDKVISPEQYQQLLDACKIARHRVLVRLAVEGGLRSGEIAGLRFGDLNLDADIPTIHVQSNVTQNSFTNGEKHIGSPKNGKSRHVPIGADFAGELARYYEWEQVASQVDGDCYLLPGKPANSRRSVDFRVPVSKYMPGNTLRSLCNST